MPAGRPTDYTPEIADKICAGVAVRKSLVKICSDADMPDPRSVYRWLRQFPEFSQNYMRAREDQADYIAEEVLEIADDSDIEPNDKRIRVDARKWLASKYRPKLYGDKVQTEHSGSLDINNLNEEQVKARILQLLAKAPT